MRGNHIHKGLSPFTVGKVLQATHKVQGQKQSLPFCNVPCDLKGEMVPCELLNNFDMMSRCANYI